MLLWVAAALAATVTGSAAATYERLTTTCQNAVAVSGELTVSSVAACEGKCDAEPRCSAVDTDGSSCYLKSRCDGTAGSCSGWCGYRRASADLCTPHAGLDCKDDDLSGGGKSGVSSTAECCALCANFTGCTTWTWYDARSMCYLKSACDNPIAKDSTSGGLVNPIPTPPPPSPTPPPSPPPPGGRTTVGISGTKWTINGSPTYGGVGEVEGTMMNARLINGIFDDSNPSTSGQWAYPDTGKWDPDRNTGEFVGNMSMWRANGMLSFTVGLQGGSPNCYGNHGWKVSAFNPDGSLRPAWMARLRRILDEADRLGMVPIVQYFYVSQFGDVQKNADAAVTAATEWLADTGLRNFVVEAFNERCDDLVSGFVDRIHSVSESKGRRLLVSSSCGGGGKKPSSSDMRKFDFILLHGNGQSPGAVTKSIQGVKDDSGYASSPKPIIYNEDDHGDFAPGDSSNLMSAVDGGASWGFLCCCDGAVQGDYATGYQCPPVAWNGHGGCLQGTAGSPQPKGSKAEWFAAVARLTKAA